MKPKTCDVPVQAIHAKAGIRFEILKKRSFIPRYRIFLIGETRNYTPVGAEYRSLEAAASCIREIVLSSPDYTIVYGDPAKHISNYTD